MRTCCMNLLHVLQEPVGRVRVSVAYLPTAEKISIDIVESTLQASFLKHNQHISGHSATYWFEYRYYNEFKFPESMQHLQIIAHQVILH